MVDDHLEGSIQSAANAPLFELKEKTAVVVASKYSSDFTISGAQFHTVQIR